MKLYDITITARIDDLDTLDVTLAADVNVAAAELQGLAMSVMPAHLRKVADDIERGASEPARGTVRIPRTVDVGEVVPDEYADIDPDR